MKKFLLSFVAIAFFGFAAPAVAQVDQHGCLSITSKEQQISLNKQALRHARNNAPDQFFALVECGADPLFAESDGRTPALWLAWRNNGEAIVKLAQINPAVLTQPDNTDWTPATWFASRNNGEIVLKLARINPAILAQVDDTGRTPALWLAQRGNGQILPKLAQINPSILTQVEKQTRMTPATWLAFNFNSNAKTLGSIIKIMQDNELPVPAAFWKIIDMRPGITKEGVMAYAS